MLTLGANDKKEASKAIKRLKTICIYADNNHFFRLSSENRWAGNFCG